MSEPSRYEKNHWKVFNFLAKFVGWGFLVVGSVIGTYFLFSVFVVGNTVDVNGVPSSDIVNRSVVVILPYVMVLLGFLMVRAKPHYPKSFEKDT
jgi:uncharacterized membrane protein